MRRTLQRCSTASIPLGALRSHPSSTSRISSDLCLRHAVRQSLPRPFRHPSRSLHTSLRFQQQQQEQQQELQQEQQQAASAAAQDAPAQDTSTNRITRFAELETHDIVHPNVVRTLTQQMGLETMTDVQQATINEALKGTDLIAQAKTGTGKTLAFLLPVLQNIIKQDPSLAKKSFGRRGPRTTADDIRALIISPTRELAEQIATEAKKLLSNTGCIVQTAVGGTAKRAGLRAIQMQGCHILVGTPGRLKDIFSDPYSRVQAPDLDALVFDEADRLLDQGFWPEIQEIMRLLPTPQEKDRQTMMFSATVPREVVDLVRSTLKPGFQFVKCVNEDEQPTHERVPQRIVQVQGFENKLPALAELVQRGIEASKQPEGRPFKAIVYYNSTAEVTLAAAALKALQPQTPPAQDAFGPRRQPHPWAPLRIFDIHSKLSQAQRTAASDLFRRCESGILMSSDVTARGMDFPNVTHVIQMSVPPSKEQYIHRIGRTARAGKEGEGWILLSPEEAREARYRLSRIPLQADTSLQTAKLDLTRPGNVPEAASTILEMLRGAMSRVPNEVKFDAYRALLGVYGWFSNKRRLVEAMNNLSSYGWALRDPPRISPILAQRLKLSRVPGVNMGATSGPMEEGGMDRRPFGGSRFGRQDSYNSRPSSRGDFGYGSDRRDSRPSGRFGGMDRSSGRGRFNDRESNDNPF